MLSQFCGDRLTEETCLTEVCPNCGFDLDNTLLNHKDHDEMFGGNNIFLNCPNCGTRLKVRMDIEYVITVVVEKKK